MLACKICHKQLESKKGYWKYCKSCNPYSANREAAVKKRKLILSLMTDDWQTSSSIATRTCIPKQVLAGSLAWMVKTRLIERHPSSCKPKYRRMV